MLLQLSTLIWYIDPAHTLVGSNAIPASIASLFLAVIFGLLTNANWLLTGIAMGIITCGALAYYRVLLDFNDPVTTSILCFSIMLMTYAMYTGEKRDKNDFL